MKEPDIPCSNIRGTLLALILAILFASVFGFGMLSKKSPVMKFCFNSRDQFVAGQCVFCDYYKFTATVLFCNGMTTALMSNISSTEAFCIMSQCLQQIRQNQPAMFGRKKRSEEDQISIDPKNDEEESTEDGDDHWEDEEKPFIVSTPVPQSNDLHKQSMTANEEMLRELESRVVDVIKVNIIESPEIEEYMDE